MYVHVCSCDSDGKRSVSLSTFDEDDDDNDDVMSIDIEETEELLVSGEKIFKYIFLLNTIYFCNSYNP